MPRNLKIGLGNAGTNPTGNKADLHSIVVVAAPSFRIAEISPNRPRTRRLFNSQKRYIAGSIML